MERGLPEKDFRMNKAKISSIATRLILSAATLAGIKSDVRADVINFLDLAPEQVQSINVGGVTITGSNTLVINAAPDAGGHGLSVLGGAPGFSYGDGTIDPTESVTFHFDLGPAVNIVLTPQLLGTLGDTPISSEGESVVTAFGPSGSSLGAVALLPSADSTRAFNISAAFSGQPISSFLFQPEGDAVNGNFVSIAALSFATVPEPASLVAWTTGALVALGSMWRRARRVCPFAK
jgi:hypothetical protein